MSRTQIKPTKYQDNKSFARGISKLLADAGFERDEWLASGRIRGWGNSTGGFEVTATEASERERVECVVKLRASSWGSKNGNRDEVLTRIHSALLAPGYTVSERDGDLVVQGPRKLVFWERETLSSGTVWHGYHVTQTDRYVSKTRDGWEYGWLKFADGTYEPVRADEVTRPIARAKELAERLEDLGADE